VVFDRTSSSLYVRTTHQDGTVTVTTSSGTSIPIANPGIYGAPGTDPRPGYIYHAYKNATAALSVDGTITAGDVGTFTINGSVYTYKVQGSDSLISVMQAFVNLINADPNSLVAAYPSNVFQRILLVANQPGAAGETIPVSANVTTGSGLILTALTSQTCCANPQGGPVTDSNPAQPGEVVYVYATGLGITTNQAALTSGQAPTADNNDPPVTPVDSILAGGSTANILFTNYVPGQLGTFTVVFQLSSSLTDNPLTQLTIAQQSFVSNVVTFNVMAGEAASVSASAAAANKKSRPGSALRSNPAPPPDPAALLRIPQKKGGPAVPPKPYPHIDKSLQKKV
jgi:uncharacterized protein (TIGR03437 family)